MVRFRVNTQAIRFPRVPADRVALMRMSSWVMVAGTKVWAGKKGRKSEHAAALG